MLSAVNSTCGAEEEAQKQKQRQEEFAAIIIAGSHESRRKCRSRGRSRGKETCKKNSIHSTYAAEAEAGAGAEAEAEAEVDAEAEEAAEAEAEAEAKAARNTAALGTVPAKCVPGSSKMRGPLSRFFACLGQQRSRTAHKFRKKDVHIMQKI